MNGNRHIDIDDLAMFALLLLSESEAAAVRQHLSECPECREELQQVRKDLGTYALAVEPVAIPTGARERFAARFDALNAPPAPQTSAGSGNADSRKADVGKAGPVLVQAKSSRSIASRIVPWIGWAAAAAVTFFAFGLKQDRDGLRSALSTETAQTTTIRANADHSQGIINALTDPHAVRVNLTIPKAAASPAARATYDPKSGALLLLASNLAPLQSHKVYELWIIPSDGSKPVPAGTFSPDAHGSASMLMPAVQKTVAAKAFGITIENVGGSATPTMPIVLAGAPA